MHIGDNEKADIDVPQKYGIDTFYVMSGKAMVANSSISMLLSEVITLNDSVSLGMVIARMMNNPFALNKTKGKIYFDNPYDFGYVVFGGVITKFLLWLYKNAKDKNVKRLYKLRKIWQMTISVVNEEMAKKYKLLAYK